MRVNQLQPNRFRKGQMHTRWPPTLSLATGRGVPKLERVDLSGRDLDGVKANKDTTWPEGFDPEAAGVIFD